MKGVVLNIEIEDRDGIRVVHLSGPLDSVTHDQFKNQLDPMFNQPHVHIVLDCENLTYVNSRGLMLLVRYYRTAASSLSFFGIAALHPRIMKGLELLGMGKLVPLYPTVEEALQAASTL